MISEKLSIKEDYSRDQTYSERLQNRPLEGFVSSAISWVTWASLFLIFGHLFVSAFFRFDYSFDYLAYHLPAALSSVGKTTFIPGPKMVAVIDGVPPLPHLVQGALVWISDRISAANSHSALLFVVFCCLIKAWFGRGISLKWFLICSLATPLFVFHVTNGYTDLFSGLCIALTFISLDRCAEADQKMLLRRSIYFILAATAAMLTKFQAWPVVFFPTLLFLVMLIYRSAKGLISLRLGLGLAMALVLLLGIWPLRNTLKFVNPTYPFSPPLLNSYFNNAPFPVADSDLRGQLPKNLWERPLAYRFLYSVFEAGRFIEPGYNWSYDQGSINGYESPHHRVGGFFPLTFMMLIAATILAYRSGMITNWAAGAFVLSLLVVMNSLPANHELRYWLYLPMTLSVWAGRSLVLKGGRVRAAIKLILIFCASYVVMQIPIFNWSTPKDADSWSHPAAKAFWNTAQKDRQQEICGLEPYAIYWSGPKFNTFPVKDVCL